MLLDKLYFELGGMIRVEVEAYYDINIRQISIHVTCEKSITRFACRESMKKANQLSLDNCGEEAFTVPFIITLIKHLEGILKGGSIYSSL